ncbi:hypothetical protein TNCV_3861161 [Trichonephila clavipes]|nr:hypothetical protein TNCV_3861161 [Trichonephila clavipes]
MYPEALMLVWLRNPTQSSAENELTGGYGNKLKNLLCFLKREGKGEERLQLAKNGMKFEFKNGRYSDYNSFLKSWEDEQIIEEVFEGGIEGRCHYLPHRGVYKECSTTQLRPVFDAACKEKE